MRAFLFAVTLAPLLSGCPSNLCLLEVNGRCEISTCGDGEAFDNQAKRCVCERGRIPLAGSCLTQQQANKYCGRGAVFTPQGCQPIQCSPGFVLDVATDQCVPKQAIDQAAGAQPGQTLACAPGTVLVVNAGAASCVPAAQTCQRDEIWNGQACVKRPLCPPGSDLDPSTMACVVVSQRPQGDETMRTVDLVQWTRLEYGANGGNGSPDLCGPLAKKPLTFAVMPGGSIRLVVQVSLSFPDGLSRSGTVQTSAIVEASGQPVTQRGAADVQQTADTILSSLRDTQSKVSPNQTSTTVRCLITNAAAPTTVPSTGGA